MVPEPVAYETFITLEADGWRPHLRMDEVLMPFDVQPTLKSAQLFLSMFNPDVFEGSPVPYSVFYPTSKGGLDAQLC